MDVSGTGTVRGAGARHGPRLGALTGSRGMFDALAVGWLYSNEEIFTTLRVSNAGGIRLSLHGGTIIRAVLMTSLQGLHGAGENPYQDRLEAGTLTYTAAGKVGLQTLAGVNSRLIEQATLNFPNSRVRTCRKQTGCVRRTQALEVPGTARVSSSLSGHAIGRRRESPPGLAFRIQNPLRPASPAARQRGSSAAPSY